MFVDASGAYLAKERLPKQKSFGESGEFGSQNRFEEGSATCCTRHASILCVGYGCVMFGNRLICHEDKYATPEPKRDKRFAT
jgi:hypothetical protein